MLLERSKVAAPSFQQFMLHYYVIIIIYEFKIELKNAPCSGIPGVKTICKKKK